jgi:hypothetical protein
MYKNLVAKIFGNMNSKVILGIIAICVISIGIDFVEIGRIAEISNYIDKATRDKELNDRIVKIIVGAVIAWVSFDGFKLRRYQEKPNPDSHVKCPDCKELVLKEASVCKHCGCKLTPQ